MLISLVFGRSKIWVVLSFSVLTTLKQMWFPVVPVHKKRNLNIIKSMEANKTPLTTQGKRMEFPDGRVFSRHGTSWPYTLAPLAILVHMHTFELSNAVLLAKLAARVCYNVESGGEHVCKAPTIWKSPQNIHTEVTCGQVVKSI